jgi:hypothetical protein
VLDVAFESAWVSGELMVVAGKRAVRVFRQSWSASTHEALADHVRSTATQVGCGIGSVASLVSAVLVLSAWSTDGAPSGHLPLKRFVIPFLIPPLFGAAIGTIIGVHLGRARAERASRGARTLEQGVAARDALVARIIGALKELSPTP